MGNDLNIFPLALNVNNVNKSHLNFHFANSKEEIVLFQF